MDSSRRAVEAYWRSRMVDNVTADDDKVTPLYKMDEICETLRQSPAGIVKEMSDYILKRLDHKSPRVKQKALRLIKHSVGKSGTEFRREMQRHSGVIRQLFHYRGEPDPLRGDSLNKAVRDIAHETVTAIFASEEKQQASEDLSKRIQGFGNTNFEMIADDKKSFLSEVVEIGSASIRQGLSIIGGQSSNSYLDGRNTSSSTYRGPSLRKSLTLERDSVPRKNREETWTPPKYLASDVNDSSSNNGNRTFNTDAKNGAHGHGYNETKGNTREERLVDSLTSAGGVRLQPTREAIQNFITMASKMDPTILSEALNIKLQSLVWQVRFKALCVLESLFRYNEDTVFEIVCTYFQNNPDSILNCRESPQASLREKANRVLSVLQGDGIDTQKGISDEKSEISAKPVTVDLPDLIDTGEADLLADDFSLGAKHGENNTGGSFDLLGDNSLSTGDTATEEGNNDPFTGLSIHSEGAQGSDNTNDLFSGLVVGSNAESENFHAQFSNDGGDLLGELSQISEQKEKISSHVESLDDIFSSLSVNQSASETSVQGVQAKNPLTNNVPAVSKLSEQPNPSVFPSLDAIMNSQPVDSKPPFISSMHNFPSNMIPQQMFPLQPMNFGSIANSLTQQQLFAIMASLPQMQMGMGASNTGFFHTNSGIGNVTGPAYSDGFDFSGDPTPTHISTADTSRKGEKTTAFDFIADHISAAKNVKKVT